MILLLLIVSLFLITYCDLKERKVYLLNLIISGLLMSFLFYKNSLLLVIYFQELLINFVFLILLIGILYIYTSLKIKKEFREVIGLGDIIFFFAIAVGFPTLSFIVVFFSSIIFSQVLFSFLNLNKKINSVPLAGFQALFLLIILIINTTFDIVDLYAM